MLCHYVFVPLLYKAPEPDDKLLIGCVGQMVESSSGLLFAIGLAYDQVIGGEHVSNILLLNVCQPVNLCNNIATQLEHFCVFTQPVTLQWRIISHRA